MDNITHTLIGLAQGEALYRIAQQKQSALSTETEAYASSDTSARFNLRQALLLSAVLANNLPDHDFIYQFLFRPSANPKLGALLYHRGYTHSIGGLIAQGVIFPLIFFLAVRFFLRKQNIKTTTLALISFNAALGCLLHFTFDGLNQYGVMSRWPILSEWYYGDALFIIEPWLWVTLAPMWYFNAKPGSGFRKLLVTFLFLAFGLCVFSGAVATAPLLALSLGAVTVSLMHFYLQPIQRIIATVVLTIATIAVFKMQSTTLRNYVVSAHDSRQSDEETINVAMSPTPANPLCFQVYTQHYKANTDEYILRYGFVTGSASYPAFDCFKEVRKRFAPNVNLRDFARLQYLPSTPELLWLDEFRAPLKVLNDAIEKHCSARAFTHFARMPIWKPIAASASSSPNNPATPEHLALYDYRFYNMTKHTADDGPEKSLRPFSKIAIFDTEPPCTTEELKRLPQWITPLKKYLSRRFEQPTN